MVKKPLKILAINSGSKYLGIAIFEGPELKDWCIKGIKGKWSKTKLKKVETILADFMIQYEPNILAMKRLHLSRTSRNLNQLVVNIKIFCQKRGLKIYQYSLGELEKFLSPGERINKKRLAEVVASHYPFLFHELAKEQGNKNPYLIRMFEAVALGSVCFHYLDRRYPITRLRYSKR